MKQFLFFLIPLFISIKTANKTFISIPFKHSKLQKDNFYSSLLLNPPYTEIKIGTPSQIIPLNISIKYSPLSIPGIETNVEKKYDKTKSSSYKILGNETPSKVNYESFLYYLNLSETINFGNDKFESIKFIYVTEKNPLQNEIGILGLYLFTNNLGLRGFNIINQLKKSNLISSYCFYFSYKNDDEGELIIGNYPHEINSKYKKENEVIANFEIDSFNNINVEINSIKYGDIEIVKNNKGSTIKTQFHFDFGLFFGNNNYKKAVLDDFFQKYLDEKKCSIENIQSDFESYVCDNSVEIKNLKVLNFTLVGKDSKINFEFTYEDLFKKINDKWYFLVFFSKNIDLEIFKLGRQFFKKYIAVFEQDKKIVKFYKNKDFGSYLYIISWILVFISLIVIGILVFYIYNNKKNKRKIRANELEDDYDYTIKNENNNPLIG